MKENWLVMYTFFSSGASLTPYSNQLIYEQLLIDISVFFFSKATREFTA